MEMPSQIFVFLVLSPSMSLLTCLSARSLKPDTLVVLSKKFVI